MTLRSSNLDYLHRVAHEVVEASRVAQGASIPGVGANQTGYSLRVPGGTLTYYPAFWTRDAAMMLGADLVPAEEIEGWIRLEASVQPGPAGIDFPHDLHIPAYSIPDHITLKGEACWFPGAYTNQGVGNFGHLPPADDAFYFIQMIYEHYRLSARRGSDPLLVTKVTTGWGDQAVYEVAAHAFDSVAVDPATGLVLCDADPSETRVDWGFCDSIRKTGSCLMPSLLRWQAARRLADLAAAVGRKSDTKEYMSKAALIAKSIPPTFFKPLHGKGGLMVSATGLGRKDDVWASAFAVWLGVLPKKVEIAVANHLLSLTESGGTVEQGQVRAMPPTGEFGGHWESALCAPETYQNGGLWATPTGWMVVALAKVDRKASDKLLGEYVDFVRSNRGKGAPFEWVHPKTFEGVNGNYASSAGLVYDSIARPR